MTDASPDGVRVTPASGAWTAVFRRDRLGGPAALSLGGEGLVADCEACLDDLAGPSAICTALRHGQQSGVAVLRQASYFPFGNQARFEFQHVLAANHLRTTFDLYWPGQSTVRSRVAAANLFLPGPWARFLCLTPDQDLSTGAALRWVDIPAVADAPVCLGQWSRPPLALLFERANGTRFEFGTGSDLWRWEQALGAGEATGNYQVLAEAGGLRVIREPLQCAAEFTPRARPYRFTWYAAWATPAAAAPADALQELRPLCFRQEGDLELAALRADASAAAATLVLDLAALPAPDGWRRTSPAGASESGGRAAGLCWEEEKLQKRVRRIVRQLAAWRTEGRLLVRGLQPGVCRDAAHVGKSPGTVLLHWDMNGLLGWVEWARHHLGPGWDVRVELPQPWSELPSLRGLFAANGFEARDDAAGAEEAAPQPLE